MKVRLLYLLAITLVVVAVVIMVTLSLLKIDRYVDYNSGALKDVVSVGNIEIESRRLPLNVFEAYPSNAIGDPSEKWHPVARTWGLTFYQAKPNYTGGSVVHAMMTVGKWFPHLDQEIAKKIKTEFLQRLARSEDEAIDYAYEVESGIVADINPAH